MVESVAVDVTSGRCRLANAGHPPPLHVGAAGIRAIADRSPLLGLEVRPAAEVEFTIESGDTLLLYTDGLIETRDERFDASLARLVRAAATVEDDLEAYASRLLAEVGPAVPGDDVAMVVVRRDEPVASYARDAQA
jgi:serine phosphatase RsbU (regulator of sigma subunit)